MGNPTTPRTVSVPELTTAIMANKLSMIRNYISELVIVTLACSVFYLYKEQNRMQNSLVEFYQADKARDLQHIIHNNSVIETNNIILRDLRQVMREVTYAKNDTTFKW